MKGNKWEPECKGKWHLDFMNNIHDPDDYVYSAEGLVKELNKKDAKIKKLKEKLKKLKDKER